MRRLPVDRGSKKENDMSSLEVEKIKTRCNVIAHNLFDIKLYIA